MTTICFRFWNERRKQWSQAAFENLSTSTSLICNNWHAASLRRNEAGRYSTAGEGWRDGRRESERKEGRERGRERERQTHRQRDRDREKEGRNLVLTASQPWRLDQHIVSELYQNKKRGREKWRRERNRETERDSETKWDRDNCFSYAMSIVSVVSGQGTSSGQTILYQNRPRPFQNDSA